MSNIKSYHQHQQRRPPIIDRYQLQRAMYQVSPVVEGGDRVQIRADERCRPEGTTRVSSDRHTPIIADINSSADNTGSGRATTGPISTQKLRGKKG